MENLAKLENLNICKHEIYYMDMPQAFCAPELRIEKKLPSGLLFF